MNTKVLLLLLAVLTSCLGIQAQTPQIIPVSPEAVALAKMVNYPVNLNTGVPNISIPLYQIEAGGLTLPIALSYHAGGFRINERSTSVGLGFSLTSDIQISRSINGIDDFTPVIGYIANTKMKTHYRNSLTCPGCTYPLYDASGLYGLNQYDLAAGDIDGMPDKFSYKLLNKSGSFYFQKSTSGTGYTIVPVPYDNIQILYDNGQFTILDTDGTKYIFGTQGPVGLASIAEEAIELSGALSTTSGECMSCKVTTWKVKTITNATKTDTIDFTYQRISDQHYRNRPESIEYFSSSSPDHSRFFRSSSLSPNSSYEGTIAAYPFYGLSAPKYIEHFSDSPSLFHMPDLNSQNVVEDHTFAFNNTVNNSFYTVAGLVVSKIEYRGGSVVFHGTDKLSSVRIKDQTGSEIKAYSFFQSYKNAFYTTEAKIVNGPDFQGTLYLDSIQGNNNEIYRFLYKEKYCFGDHLKGKDAWGYSNASTAERYTSKTTISVPHQKLTERFYFENSGQNNSYVDGIEFNIGNPLNTEAPDRSESQRGILKRIIYPTGGYVDFDFESNMYKAIPNEELTVSVRMGGGLRIKNINYFDGKSMLPVSQKYYRYGDMEDGIGLLRVNPSQKYDELEGKYNAYSYNQVLVYVTSPGSINIGDNFDPIDPGCYSKSCIIGRFVETKTTYMPASYATYTYPGGAPIYYTKVTEYNQDMGKNTGKKVYTFYKPDEFYTSPFENIGKIPDTNIDVMLSDGLTGEQKLFEEYKYHNGRYMLVHSKESTYTKFTKPEEVKVVYSFFNVIYNLIGSFAGTNRDLYDGSKSFSSMPDHEGDDFVSGQYGIEVGKLLLSSENEKWMEGPETFSRTTSYSYEKIPYLQLSKVEQTNSKGQNIIKRLKYAYDYSGQPIYDEMVSKNMISQLIEETVHNGSVNREISRAKTNYAIANSDVQFIAPASIEKSIGGQMADILVTFDLYDSHANILQITEKNALVKSYLWGYGYKYPLAEITGSTYASVSSNINLTTLHGLTNEGQLRTALANLRVVMPEAMITSFTYKPQIGVSSKTTASGLTSFYQYDVFGRLQTIRDHDNHILKKYDYHMTNANSSLANNLYYVNSPYMATYNKICEDLSIRSYNYIEPGGKHYSPDWVSLKNAVDSQAELNAVAYGEADCTGSQQMVKISLSTLFYEIYRPVPEELYIDFIKDGSVVASKRFPYQNNTYVDLYLPAGEYRVNLRQDYNFNGSVVKCYMSNGYWDPFKPGSTHNFLPGIAYEFEANNNIL